MGSSGDDRGQAAPAVHAQRLHGRGRHRRRAVLPRAGKKDEPPCFRIPPPLLLSLPNIMMPWLAPFILSL